MVGWIVRSGYIFAVCDISTSTAPVEPRFWWSTRTDEQVFTSHRWSAISPRGLTCLLVKLLEWYMCPSKALVSQFFKYQTLTNFGVEIYPQILPMIWAMAAVNHESSLNKEPTHRPSPRQFPGLAPGNPWRVVPKFRMVLVRRKPCHWKAWHRSTMKEGT